MGKSTSLIQSSTGRLTPPWNMTDSGLRRWSTLRFYTLHDGLDLRWRLACAYDANGLQARVFCWSKPWSRVVFAARYLRPVTAPWRGYVVSIANLPQSDIANAKLWCNLR